MTALVICPRGAAEGAHVPRTKRDRGPSATADRACIRRCRSASELIAPSASPFLVRLVLDAVDQEARQLQPISWVKSKRHIGDLVRGRGHVRIVTRRLPTIDPRSRRGDGDRGAGRGSAAQCVRAEASWAPARW